MRLPPHFDSALIRALHSTEGAAARWGATLHLDDETLRRRIAEEFGIQGGFSLPGERVDYWGGTNPRIEIQIGADTPVELSGRELLTAVREALSITRPGELF